MDQNESADAVCKACEVEQDETCEAAPAVEEAPGDDVEAADAASSHEIVTVGEWELDLDACSLTVAGAPVELEFAEYALAETLASRPGHVFTYQELIERMWDEGAGKGESDLEACVAGFREKLAGTGTERYVSMVWKKGYRLQSPAFSARVPRRLR